MLEREIEDAKRLVRTDAYQMSIGELVSNYKDGELLINPDFQRLFRWEIGQKAKFIESLLLGIPVPPIFVFEMEDESGSLQRVSTLLEFMGLLKAPGSNQLEPPTALVATGYLPSLDKVYLTLRKKPYKDLERQIYVNKFLGRLDALHQRRINLEERCELVNEILDGTNGTFRYLNPALIDTKSNLNTDVIKEICLICSVEPSHFETKRTFIDQTILKRRNAIAHGQSEFIQEDEIDDLVAEILGLMQHFRTLLENKIYLKQYAA